LRATATVARWHPEAERWEPADVALPAAEALTARLQVDGMTVVRRSRFVVVAAATEDDAAVLADRIRTEAEDARSVTAEGSAAVAMDELSPFAALSNLLRRR
jgi:hypothetical protein